jgi:hypothetical protein
MAISVCLFLFLQIYPSLLKERRDVFAPAQVDRPSATAQRCGEVESAIFDLFAQLGASEEQLDFPVLYASAREVRQLGGEPACWKSWRSEQTGCYIWPT